MSALALTAEELHALAGACGLTTVPGLGPLPLDPSDEASLRLMLGTANRSLRARGLVERDAPVREVAALLAPLADPEWLGTAARWNERERTARAWCRRGRDVTELAQLAPTDYKLTPLAPGDVRERIADFHELRGDDDAEGEPETPDEERMRTLVADPAWIAEGTQFGSGTRVAVQWIDPGAPGPVWRLGDSDRIQVIRTGRAAILARLTPT